MTMKASIAILAAALVLAGTWVTGTLAPDVMVHGLLLAAWVAVLATAAWFATQAHRGARRAALGAIAVALVVVLSAGAWLSRPKTVDEDIVVADGRAVLRARVFNEEALFHVASFLTVADGLTVSRRT